MHRDLKPGNVMVTREGRVKVLDFGLAKLEGPHSDPNLTNTPTETRADLTGEGQVFGTVAYMSPEQARGGKVDARSDVFSLGVVIYQLLTGERPFQGGSAVDMISSILRDKPPSVTDLRADLPPHLARILRRCLEKDPRDRYQTSRDVYNELRELRAETSTASTAASASSPRSDAGVITRPPSGPIRVDEEFWVAVLPFKSRGADPGLEALAEGMTEEIVTGLSRFSYLRVIARTATSPYAREAVDGGSSGKELGARYVIEGSLRLAGTKLRIAVQLVDTSSGAHLWAENYERTFSAEAVFELQDDLVPRIVSTVADSNGILARSMSEAVRGRDPEHLTPYEAVLRSFGYGQRVTPEELTAARFALELAVRKAPAYADAWAMLAWLHVQDYAQGFNLQADSLASGLAAAQRAVEAAPSNPLAYFSLAPALFFQRELQSFRNAADRAVALNPMDGNSIAFLGELLTYAGDWERGMALAGRAKQLNPNYPGWYWYADFYNAYRQGDYRSALSVALKVNLPGQWFSHAATAAAFGQLGERDAAAKAVRDLLRVRPDFAATVRSDIEKWWEPEYVESMIDGWRKAGLEIAGETKTTLHELDPVRSPTPGSGATRADEGFWVAVLPFKHGGGNADVTALAEGLSEEIVAGLSRFSYLRVITSGSTQRYADEATDLRVVGKDLGARYVMNGNLRQVGARLRVAVQLVDTTTGAHLWAENYERTFSPEAVFELQDDLVPRIVSTVADSHGVLLHSMSEALRSKSADQLSPYEAVLRSFGYFERVNAQELAAARSALELAVRKAPG
ncbi:MAG: protein kinase, partial [Acidobacteriota bacterium]